MLIRIVQRSLSRCSPAPSVAQLPETWQWVPPDTTVKTKTCSDGSAVFKECVDFFQMRPESTRGSTGCGGAILHSQARGGTCTGQHVPHVARVFRALSLASVTLYLWQPQDFNLCKQRNTLVFTPNLACKAKMRRSAARGRGDITPLIQIITRRRSR